MADNEIEMENDMGGDINMEDGRYPRECMGCI